MRGCPSAQQLRDLLVRDSCAAEMDSLVEHVEDCNLCQQQLEEWTATAARDSGGMDPTAAADAPCDREFLQRLKDESPPAVSQWSRFRHDSEQTDAGAD